MPLTVPIPTFAQGSGPATTLVADKPITLSCAPVTFADGTTLSPSNAKAFTYLMFRESLATGSEVWDSTAKTWRSAAATVAAQPLFWMNQTWQSLLAAIGNDSSGQPAFQTDPTTGYPIYTTQFFFTGTDSQGVQQSGQSLLSAAVTILAAGTQNRAGVSINPSDPTQATDLRIFLKDSSLTEQGHVRIFQDGSGFHVELFSGGARVVVSNNGAIALSPAAGQVVEINGSLAVTGTVSSGGIVMAVP
jgi:hypothetical protein